jgi:hypothetical protein
MIRPFEILDLPLLNRYRQHGLYLDSVHTLTWGKSLVSAAALASPLSSATGVFTSLFVGDHDKDQPVIGQVSHTADSPFARFTYLAPDSNIESPGVAPLIEDLISQVGRRGAQNLVADVEEKSQIFDAFRQSQFSIYARQHIWRVDKRPDGDFGRSTWRDVLPIDEIKVRRLYNELVPTLVQQIEPVPWEDLTGYAYYNQGELRAYVHLVFGPRGKWVQPFIHPEMESVGQKLRQLIWDLRPTKNRPVYICLRSYQAWLAWVLEDIQAQKGPSQAVMVRRLTAAVKKPLLTPIPQINGNTEPTTTFIEIEPDSK